MTSEAVVGYVWTQLINHARLFFADSAVKLLQGSSVRFLPYAEAAAARGGQIAVPTDVPIPLAPESPWKVPFNSTTLTLWNPMPRPDGDGWQAVPNEAAPVWYRHASGTLMPSWNLFGNVFDLLTFGEEHRSTQRDRHGRFDWTSSLRLEQGLLDVPAVNEATALLVAAAVSVSRSEPPSFVLDSLSGPPVVVLSHDCDILTGNDFITQSVRLYRFLQPLAKVRLPRPGNLWWIARNAATPRRFYFDNATGMVDIERCFGCTSTYYLLNGSGGRFGARSPFSEISRLINRIPPPWEIGIHYNYHTFLNQDKFAAQLRQLQQVVPNQIVSGRAHYLRFDPARSFSFLQQFGIYVDESSGWPDKVGYRNGIAGCFQAFDPERNSSLDIWEVPMIVMDDALVAQYGSDSAQIVAGYLQHLSRIGGALTILFHPGQFLNPEHPGTSGVYHEILKVCRRAGVVTQTARSLVDRLRK